MPPKWAANTCSFVNVHVFQNSSCLLLSGIEIIFFSFFYFLVKNAPWVLLQKPFNVYFVLAADRQGQPSCYLKQEDKVRVSLSGFYLVLGGTLFKQPRAVCSAVRPRFPWSHAGNREFIRCKSRKYLTPQLCLWGMLGCDFHAVTESRRDGCGCMKECVWSAFAWVWM